MNPALVIGCCAAASQTPVGQDIIGCIRGAARIGADLIGEPLDRVTAVIGSAAPDILIADEAPRCNTVGCIVGAEALAETSGVWLKTRFHRDGHFMCATVYSVSAGEPEVFQLKIDMRPIARELMRLHTAMHAQDAAQATVRGEMHVGFSLGSVWKSAKKAASSVAKSKLVKGVVKVTKAVAKGAKAVVKSKAVGVVAAGLAAFPLTAPIGVAALGAYGAANAALTAVEAGRKVVSTAKQATTVVKQGATAAKAVTSAKKTTATAIKTAAASMTPAQKAAAVVKTKAAANIQLNAKGKVAVVTALAKAPAAKKPAVAKAVAAKLKTAAAVKASTALAKALPPKAGKAVVASTKLQVAAAPVIAKAKATAAKLAQPGVKARLTDILTRGVKNEAAIKKVVQGANAGSLDAKKSAAVLNLVARNRARIQAMSQANAGGMPGLLITSRGQIRRGKWRVSPIGQGAGDAGALLYTGPGQLERGAFATVSGLLPSDGVRMMGPGSNVYGIGPYGGSVAGLIGCEDDELCTDCAASG